MGLLLCDPAFQGREEHAHRNAPIRQLPRAITVNDPTGLDQLTERPHPRLRPSPPCARKPTPVLQVGGVVAGAEPCLSQRVYPAPPTSQERARWGPCGPEKPDGRGEAKTMNESTPVGVSGLTLAGHVCYVRCVEQPV